MNRWKPQWPGVRGTAVLAAALAIGVLGVACAESIDDVTPVTGVTEVAVRDDLFDPRAIEVLAGTEVTWTWEGANNHNVVGDGWNSPVQSSGTFSHRFDEAGTHDYQCTLHSGMTGRVIVTE